MRDNIARTGKKYRVPAVDQAIRVMLCLADNGTEAKSLTDISREVGIHRSKAFSILNTLYEYGFVKKNPNRGGYVLGTGLLTLAGHLLESLGLPRLVEPILYDLARKAGATVALGVISDNRTIVVAQYEGSPGIGISSPIGHVRPITYGAHGKAIAALLPENELEDLLNRGSLYFYGKPEKYDRTRLLRDLEQCRRDGFATEMGDMVPGVNAIGTALIDQNSRPVGYITIVGFFDEAEARKIGPMAAATVKKISQETGNMISWKRAANG
jgi:DNA-binding IclR family transcriptional regulator